MKPKPIRGWEDSCSHNDNVKCPYCGYVDCEPWEYNLDDGEEDYVICSNCEEMFSVIATVSITYSSYPE